MALLELTEDIRSVLDQKKCITGVFINLKKVFCTVDHKLLLKKIEAYGIRGVANHWLKSYLLIDYNMLVLMTVSLMY